MLILRTRTDNAPWGPAGSPSPRSLPPCLWFNKTHSCGRQTFDTGMSLYYICLSVCLSDVEVEPEIGVDRSVLRSEPSAVTRTHRRLPSDSLPRQHLQQPIRRRTIITPHSSTRTSTEHQNRSKKTCGWSRRGERCVRSRNDGQLLLPAIRDFPVLS